MHCSKCQKMIERSYSGMCQSCYRYYHQGGGENPLPALGKIEYDHRGYVVCHICGRAYKRLGSHIKESHKMTIKDYKEKFGLCNNAKTTEKEYSERMHQLAYENNMPQRLSTTGIPTRIKVGEKDKRLGKKVRLQESLDRSERYKNKKKEKME